MRTPKKTLAAGVAVVAALGIGVRIAGAASSNSGDRDTPITGAALARASAAALAHTGGGAVTDTEVGDEESYYEVEVTMSDGSQHDVQLDKAFAVVGDKVERGEAADDGADDDTETADD